MSSKPDAAPPDEGDEFVMLNVPGIGVMTQRTYGLDPEELVGEWVGHMTEDRVDGAEYQVVRSTNPRGPDRWPG